MQETKVRLSWPTTAVAAATFACAALAACNEVTYDDQSTLQADVLGSDDGPEDSPARSSCDGEDCHEDDRGTPVSPSSGRGAQPEPEHPPRVLPPMVAVPFDPESEEALDPPLPGLERSSAAVAELAAELTVVVELADDAPIYDRPFDAPRPSDSFTTWFVVTEVIAGNAAVADSIVVKQALTAGFPKSDGFLLPVHGRKYVLMLDASAQDNSTYILAGGAARGHHAFLTQRDDGEFAFDRGFPMDLDNIRTLRSQG